MNPKEIPEDAIVEVANSINSKVNKTPNLSSPVTVEDDCRTPQYFEIVPFEEIDNSERNFYAIDGSYNFQEFYNGVCIGVYTAGYISYHHGKQIKLNDYDDPVINGKSYFPNKLMITSDTDKEDIFDELLTLEPVKKFLEFLGNPDDWCSWASDLKRAKETISKNPSTLFSFCQNVLEYSLVYEIANLPTTKSGDFILRDGNLRSMDIEQKYIRKLGKFLHDKGFVLLSITKNSPIKLQLSSTFRRIDNYLQSDLKYKFKFAETEDRKKKICCWLEVDDGDLDEAYKGNQIARKGLSGGRGFGLYFVARLDYVEKLQNYDWVIVDLNIYDAIPTVNETMKAFDVNRQLRDFEKLNIIFRELTRLTQEHYILGYPYPLAEAHNFVTLKNDFKREIINRVKLSLYQNSRMDNVDIENLFLDIHSRF
jgi:hypothetical protein